MLLDTFAGSLHASHGHVAPFEDGRDGASNRPHAAESERTVLSEHVVSLPGTTFEPTVTGNFSRDFYTAGSSDFGFSVELLGIAPEALTAATVTFSSDGNAVTTETTWAAPGRSLNQQHHLEPCASTSTERSELPTSKGDRSATWRSLVST